MDVTGTIEVYDNFLLEWARGNVQPETDTLIAGLSGPGYVPALEHTDINSILDELAGNGYARQTLQNVAVSLENHVPKVTCDDFAFEASGGELNPRWWWVFDDTHAEDILVCFGLISESLAADPNGTVVMIPSQPLTHRINFNGLVRLKR